LVNRLLSAGDSRLPGVYNAVLLSSCIRLKTRKTALSGISLAIRVDALKRDLQGLLAVERNPPVVRDKIVSFPNEHASMYCQLEWCFRAIGR
jgi:hypothetical protein